MLVWLKGLLARLFPYARVGGWARYGDFDQGSAGVGAPLAPKDPVLVGAGALEMPTKEEPY